MRVLHLSHHDACVGELEYVGSRLGFSVETMRYPHGYNISREKAAQYWEEHKAKFNSFDVVLTSDTAALSRIILQNIAEFKGYLIIWVCNRFDYCDNATNDCGFPDEEYYELFRSASRMKNVSIISYTAYEHSHARQKNVEIGSEVIKPTGLTLEREWTSAIPDNVRKNQTFFIPNYHNDTRFVDLSALCSRHGVRNYQGRYNGAQDLADFKGIVHIPYAWSNFALFENLQRGSVYFIPSLPLILQWGRCLYTIRHPKYQRDIFFWSPPYESSRMSISEWYLPEHRNLFVHFDSWEQLAVRARTTDIDAKKHAIRQWAKSHADEMLNRWRSVFKRVG